MLRPSEPNPVQAEPPPLTALEALPLVLLVIQQTPAAMVRSLLAPRPEVEVEQAVLLALAFRRLMPIAARPTVDRLLAQQPFLARAQQEQTVLTLMLRMVPAPAPQDALTQQGPLAELQAANTALAVLVVVVQAAQVVTAERL